MRKQDIYRLLEEKALGYADYAGVPVRPSDEPLVAIPSSKNLTASQVGTDMLAYTPDGVYVRSGVLSRLQQAAGILAAENKELQLEVGYGYRALEVQTRLFEEYKTKLADRYSGDELLAAVHRSIAVPGVAGHPAGAAVDIQILREAKPLDFGTAIWEFTPDSFTFSPFISRAAWDNRQLLRRVMMQAGFAPFDGEWWHFCYGDKEWAKYYDKPAALYDQVSFLILI